MSSESDKGRPRRSVISLFLSGWARAATFALIWWILTGGAAESWLVGVPAVLAATWVSMALMLAFPWSPAGLIYFLPLFAWQSLRGGVDVAWRAFHPWTPIAPGLVEYPLRLPPGLPRVFMTNTVSLLPGTLSAELGADCLILHVLDTQKSVLSELTRVEQAVARMFATALKNTEGDGSDEAT